LLWLDASHQGACTCADAGVAAVLDRDRGQAHAHTLKAARGRRLSGVQQGGGGRFRLAALGQVV
jgi:hypothetical protein